MKAPDLIESAIRFATQLNEDSPRKVTCQPVLSRSAFGDVYRENMPNGSGVYLFHFAEGEVFYIGKTNTKEFTFAKRVWAHFYAPSLLQTGTLAIRTKELELAKLSLEEQGLVSSMQFRIDYLRIDPPQLADLLEVYLQSVYFLSRGALPKCNAQFG